MNYLTVDFGSTYTKLVAVNSKTCSILGTATAFTTIDTDIMDGYNAALTQLESEIGKFSYDKLLCCSSAGGGLKMVALGLVPELTAKAARMAASSAGAKVVKTYAFEISRDEAQEIEKIDADLILLSGGTDGGNKEVLIANAKRLASIKGNFSIIVAGNKSASFEVEDILKESGKEYIITDNVMPTFNTLNIEPAKACIRDLFIRRIIDAKGLSKAQAMATNEIIPTPSSVLLACELLSKGTKTSPGIGDLMAADIGGATTDIYSMAKGEPTLANVIFKGLPEPFNKRTVEGDLGMRYSLASLSEQINFDLLPEGLTQEDIEEWIHCCIENPNTIAEVEKEKEELIEAFLANTAVKVAVERHCGFMESIFTPMGQFYSLNGKDLTEIPYVIGIGGAIVNSKHQEYILSGAKYDIQKHGMLKPKNPKYKIDQRYIFSAMGLLSTIDAELALALMKKEIKSLAQ